MNSLKRKSNFNGRSSLCYFILTILLFSSCSSTVNIIKVGLIIEYESPPDLSSYFSMMVTDYNRNASDEKVQLQGVTLKWDVEKPPIHNMRLVDNDVIQENLTVVLSYLSYKNNAVLCDLLKSSEIVLINLRDECHRTTAKDNVLSLQPPQDLLAAATRNTIMELDQSRFSCITTFTMKDDPFWTFFFSYIHDSHPNSTQSIPKCLILRDHNDIIKIRELLAAVRSSGVKIIILHAESVYVSEIWRVSQQLSLQNIGKDIIWVLTDMPIRGHTQLIPAGTIGIAKAFNTSQYVTDAVSHFDGMDKLFVEDSIVAIWRAINSVAGRNTGFWKNTEQLVGRQLLYREMLNDRFTGQTGLIKFSTVGQRVTYDFIITTLLKDTDESKHWIRLGRIPVSRRENVGPSALTAFTVNDLPQPRHLKIVTIIHSPFTMIKHTYYSNILGKTCDSKNSVLCKRYSNTTLTEKIMRDHPQGEPYEMFCCFGIMIDILLLIQQQTGFTYELYIVRDGKFGSFDKTTQRMTGMIGDVHRGEADMALSTLTITRHRYDYVTFTSPYMGTSLAFLVKRQPIKKYPFPESLQDMRLMKPFSVELWIACGGTFLTVSTSVFLIEKLVRYLRKRKSEYFLPFEYLTYVFGNIFHVPLTRIHAQSFAVPCLMVWANFGALVLISSYTANLLVSLIVVDEVSIVEGIHDERLLNPSKGFTFATIKDSSSEDFFSKSDVPFLNQIYENMKDYGVHNFSDGIKRVKSGELSAFIGESDALQYIIDEDPECGLKLDGKQIDLAGLAFALRKDSEWEQTITKAVHELNEREAIRKAFERWTIRSCKLGENKVVPYKMGLDEFGGFLFNTALCCVGCFFILGVEILFYRRIMRIRQKFTVKTPPTESLGTFVTSISTEAIVTTNNNESPSVIDPTRQLNGHINHAIEETDECR